MQQMSLYFCEDDLGFGGWLLDLLIIFQLFTFIALWRAAKCFTA